MEILKDKLLLFIIILYVISAGLLLNANYPMIDEEPYYFLLSQSIVSGEGYRNIFCPYNFFHIEYPPFYPLLMALVLTIFPQTIVGLRMLSIFFGVALLVVIYSFFYIKNYKIEGIKSLLNSTMKKSIIFKWKATTINKYLLLFLVCTNPLFLAYSVRMVAEMSYMFFSLITILFFEKHVENNNRNKLYLWMGGITLILALYTKMIGWSLVVAVLLYFFVKKRYREFLLIGGSSVFLFLPWIIRNILLNEIASEYLDLFISGFKTYPTNISKLVIWNITHYGCVIKYVFSPGYFLNRLTWEFPSLFSLVNQKNFFNFSFPGLFSGFLISIILCGFYFKNKKKFSLLSIYVLCYLIIISLCPFNFFLNDGKRYLYQMVPFFSYYFISGLFNICQKTRFLHVNENKVIVSFFTFIIIIPNLIGSIYLVRGNINYLINCKKLSKEEKMDYYAPWHNIYLTAALWVNENLSSNVRIMSNFPYTFYLYSQHKTIWYPSIGEVISRSLESIKEGNVDYIVVAIEEDEELIKKLNHLTDEFVFIPIYSFIRSVAKNAHSGFSKIYKVIAIDSVAKEFYKKGTYYCNKRDYKQAIFNFEEGLKVNFDLVGYYNLGIIYENKGFVNKSINMYKEALKIEPHFEIVKNRLNVLLQKRIFNQDKENLTEFKKLGDYYLKNNNYQKAIDVYTKYLLFSEGRELLDNKKRINQSLVYYNLGKAYFSRGDYDKAIASFKETLKIAKELKYKIKHHIKIANKFKER